MAEVARPILPPEVDAEAGSIKLFNKWSFEGTSYG